MVEVQYYIFLQNIYSSFVQPKSPTAATDQQIKNSIIIGSYNDKMIEKWRTLISEMERHGNLHKNGKFDRKFHGIFCINLGVRHTS